jgi:hypothetical protein
MVRPVTKNCQFTGTISCLALFSYARDAGTAAGATETSEGMTSSPRGDSDGRESGDDLEAEVGSSGRGRSRSVTGAGRI